MDKIKSIVRAYLNFKKDLARLVPQIKKSPKNIEKILDLFAKENKLSDEEYATMLEKLIRIYSLDTVSKEHKEKLKEISKRPKLKIYLQGILF